MITTAVHPDLARALVECTAAIDAGDDSVLPILADVLEELQDPRAAGLRRLGHRRPYHDICDVGDCYVWHGGKSARTGPERAGVDLDRLAGARRYDLDDKHGVRLYLTRSAAILALAAVLVVS